MVSQAEGLLGVSAVERLCRNCGRAPGTRARGLCWACFQKRGVRRRFPMLRKSFRPDRCEGRPMPPTPTNALPGTEAKVGVFRRRAARRMQLWHPQDARIPD